MRSDRWTNRFDLTGSAAALALAVALAGPATAQDVKPANPAAETAPDSTQDSPLQKPAAPVKSDAQRTKDLITNTRPTNAPGVPAKQAVDAPAVNPNEAPVIEFVPPIADMGEMAADTAKTITVQIKNVHSEPIRISKAIPGCGCTTPVWPKDPIPPGGMAPCEITLKPGSTQGMKPVS